MKKIKKSVAVGLFGAGLTAASLFGEPSVEKSVSFPEGYRKWVHIKSMIIEDGHPITTRKTTRSLCLLEDTEGLRET